MKKVISGIGAAAIAVGVIGTWVSSAQAKPLLATRLNAVKQATQWAQFRRDDDRDRFNRRDHDRRRFDKPRFERRGDWGYYNGHRGYREYRRGYREYNGWWFPPAALVAGAIIGGVIANQPAGRTPRLYCARTSQRGHVN